MWLLANPLASNEGLGFILSILKVLLIFSSPATIILCIIQAPHSFPWIRKSFLFLTASHMMCSHCSVKVAIWWNDCWVFHEIYEKLGNGTAKGTRSGLCFTASPKAGKCAYVVLRKCPDIIFSTTDRDCTCQKTLANNVASPMRSRSGKSSMRASRQIG